MTETTAKTKTPRKKRAPVTEDAAQAASPPGGRSSSRREQQRSIETRLSILEAALTEFAEKGFDGASMRTIGDRAGLHYTLITYHFRSKDALWKATAEHFYKEIEAIWNAEAHQHPDMDPIDRIREEFGAFMRFTLEHPDFHQFMVRESREASPRLPWLLDTFQGPLMKRTLPQIQAAQDRGDLPHANPVLIHYFLIGVTSVLSSLGAEIRHNSGLSPEDPEVSDQFWTLIEQIIFKRKLYNRSK
jgi:AcrR family transcriptional regulator